MLVRENHPRQEAYLKRVLNKDQYHDIRIIEPCIVESAFDKKVYQFVVVDSKGISLEGCVPMKVIHFSDVTSIDMNPKKPKFLKGREQEDARHVEVKYKTNKKLNKEVEKELNKFIKKIKTKSKKKERNSSDNILTTEQIPQENNRSSLDNQLGTSRDKSSRINILEETMQSGDNEEIDEITNNQKRSPTDRYVLINLPTKPKTHSRALSLNSKYEEPQIVDALKHCLILDIHHKDKSIDIMINKSTDIVDIKSGVIGIQENIFNQYIGREEFDDFILLKLETSNRSCLDEEVMDIYFFNDRSHFYVILKQAWMNYKLRTTSEEERIMFMDEPDDCTITQQMFVNLKTELLANLIQDRSLSLEELEMCKLFLKLGLAFRRIFWKDGLLFSSLTTRLKILTSKVMEDIKSKQFDAAEMSNAFASSLIVMEILCLSLRETEIFKGRMSHVTGSKGRDLLVIAEFILAEMNLSGDDDISEEILNFYVDFASWSIDLMFHVLLLLTIHSSISIGCDGGGFIDVDWIVNSVTDPPGFNHFLDRVMTLLTSLTDEDKLSPSCTLFVYKSFYIIDKLIKFSPHVGGYMKKKYRIDFKYTFNENFVKTKIPKNLMISADIFQLTNRVMRRILTQK